MLVYRDPLEVGQGVGGDKPRYNPFSSASASREGGQKQKHMSCAGEGGRSTRKEVNNTRITSPVAAS